jgi:hypothetical protein
LRQVPHIDHEQTKSDIVVGTKITIEWPEKACLNESDENANSYKTTNGRVEKASFEPRRDPLLYFRGKYRRLHFT